MKSFEEYLDQEHRREERRQRQQLRSVLRRHQSREELRRQRRIAAVCFMFAVLSVALAVLVARQALFNVAGGSYSPVEQTVDLGPQIGSAEVIEPVKEKIITEVAVPTPDPDEAEKIEAALVEQGYLREDIPLSYEEQDYLHTACEEFGIQYELAVAVVWKETTFRNIMGDNGKSYGYMQIKKSCHEDRMAELGVTDLMDPYSNFRVGCHYLADLIAKYEGNVEMALMAYNAGPSKANELWFSQGIYSNSYSQKVLGYMEGLLNDSNND